MKKDIIRKKSKIGGERRCQILSILWEKVHQEKILYIKK